MDRPTYSTPAPVENIPANNECRMVEVMGSKVASFKLDEDDYICLPQVYCYVKAVTFVISKCKNSVPEFLVNKHKSCSLAFCFLIATWPSLSACVC